MTRPLTDLELRYTGMMSENLLAAYDRGDRIAVIWRLQVFTLSFRTSPCNHGHAPQSIYEIVKLCLVIKLRNKG